MGKIELLAPAGDFETALAAFDAGADAVYCGLSEFSARAFARNLTFDDLRSLMRVAVARGRKVYVTFNTLVDEDSVDDAVRMLGELDAICPSALIVQDLGIARLCRRCFPSLELHASTQLVCHNLEGALALKDLGFTRVVLARELSADETASITRRSGGLEFEAFVHGALCYSVSGLCLYSAMEKGRSGNRGRCAYCCRMPCRTSDGGALLPFSMKDLRLGADARRLADAGVCSLKIEGRMKSSLYVASVTRYYRQILDGTSGVTISDLETVYSRRTTCLYIDGRGSSGDVIDTGSLGHLGTLVGHVKRVTRDREGRAWLRFHTSRALEKHDGIQFEARTQGEKPVGFGISQMRLAISRTPVFEAAAGSDVEILLPDEGDTDFPGILRAGDGIYCSMSNAVKRMFPSPSCRPGDYPGTVPVDVEVILSRRAVSANARCRASGETVAAEASSRGEFAAAKNPERTADAVRKALSRLGGTDYRLGEVSVSDPEGVFIPPATLNDLRRDLAERLDGARDGIRRGRVAAALADDALAGAGDSAPAPAKSVRIRAGQSVPSGDWDEVVVAIDEGAQAADIAQGNAARLALPVYTPEPRFNALRSAVKRLLRAGFVKWEASDLATLSMLRRLGVEDVTADWTLYAFNASALRALSDLGVRRFVASPENGRDNMQFLSESGFSVAFLAQQSTPLFISLTKPAAEPSADSGLSVYGRGVLWVTTKRMPRTFCAPAGAPLRYDLSWDPPHAVGD